MPDMVGGWTAGSRLRSAAGRQEAASGMASSCSKIGTLPYFRRFYPRAEALRARDAHIFVRENDTVEARNREASHGVRMANMKVLIAEDDATSRIVLDTVLRKWGYEVVSASDGNEVLLALSQGSDAPKLLILDWMMPGMDGIEVCRRIRQNGSGFGKTAPTAKSDPPYVILLTSLGRKEDILTGFEAGADDYVMKPFDRDELRARVNAGLRILELQSAMKARVTELEGALAHIRTLQGILPICMHCHKIRNDQESWERLESYLQHHSDVQFSHGLCPECLVTYYPNPEEEKGVV